VVLNALSNFGIIFGLFTVFLLVSGQFPGAVFLLLVPVVGLMVLLAIGFGMVLGVLNVFFRDVGQFFTIFLQFWFWLTPIVYPSSIIPEGLRDAMAYNPMAAPIKACQDILVTGQAPHWASLTGPFVLSLLLCALGLHLFRRRAGEMVDEL
jgi:lipopolysaccharide transport system permease protein